MNQCVLGYVHTPDLKTRTDDLAGGAAGLCVIDISDPSDISLLAQMAPASFYTMGIDVDGDYAYAANQSYGVGVVQVYERGIDVTSNTGRSLVVNAIDDLITHVKLSSTQSDSIYWHVSADSGSTWESVVPGDGV